MLKGTIYVNYYNANAAKNPGIDQLFNACRNCYASPAATVSFWVKLEGAKSVGRQIEVNVRGVDHESGTPGMLLLKGYLKEDIDGHSRYEAFYDAREGRGTGHITLLRSNEKES